MRYSHTINRMNEWIYDIAAAEIHDKNCRIWIDYRSRQTAFYLTSKYFQCSEGTGKSSGHGTLLPFCKSHPASCAPSPHSTMRFSSMPLQSLCEEKTKRRLQNSTQTVKRFIGNIVAADRQATNPLPQGYKAAGGDWFMRLFHMIQRK